MKKLLSLLLATVIILSAAAALADPVKINGLEKRDIKINEAGLNPSADEMIAQGISPTTGRQLDSIPYVDGFAGTAYKLEYQPIMVQISNAGGGINIDSKGRPATAPVNLHYADVVYEACQANSANGGSLTRFSAVFSDTVPDYVGFVRSTRATHPRLRQEWDCAFVTSGYNTSVDDVKKQWAEFGVSPFQATKENPGLVYVQNMTSYTMWTQYMFHATGIGDANDHVYQLANLWLYTIPRSHTPANHTFKFTDEVPEGGDSGTIIDVKFGNGEKTDSQLQYDEENNVYLRYIPRNKTGELTLYRSQELLNPEPKKVNVKGSMIYMVNGDERVPGEAVTFSNVIIQGISMKWYGSERPNPTLTGTGIADYFMGGKHYKGVWQRKDMNSRTVFYGEDGNEIELQRGKTLIILMDYDNKGRSVSYE